MLSSTIISKQNTIKVKIDKQKVLKIVKGCGKITLMCIGLVDLKIYKI